MPKYEVTIRELPDDNGWGCLIFIVLFICVVIFGDSAEDKISYWKGDKNFPIFTQREDGSMVVFKKILRGKLTSSTARALI